ncbi:unnamed protein product [Caenorhabditis auriculariae]|uniref:Receptor ligand binding region domain-containing protein n=1 Tax=Caenorhabditis auriculariae TaxID=2777116 RepID=A0A8S1HHX2_9PELO|nr:unnamed protein product [Caenorhabditis auriculariae]
MSKRPERTILWILSVVWLAATVKVKVGHIGAVNVMKNGDKILELSRRQLVEEGVLGDDFEIEIVNQMGCGEAFEGVAVGADMYHVQGVRAFLGPYCNAELDAVAKMATFWNIPIIGYMASSNVFADKSIYKTLARVSLRTTNSLAEATAAMLKHYGFGKVAIVTNTGAAAYERTAAFEEVFHMRDINVVKKKNLWEKDLTDNDKRAIVVGRQNGLTMMTLAGMFGVTEACISQFLKRWKAQDGTVKSQRTERPRVIDRNGDRNILKTPRTNPRLTAPAIRREVFLNSPSPPSVSTVKRRLNAAGIMGRRAVKKPLISEKNRVARVKWAKEHLTSTMFHKG